MLARVRMMNTRGTDGQRYALMAAWLLLALGATLLAVRYPDMPSMVPVYRDASGQVATFAPKSALMVMRIAGMGVGQLGVTSAMWIHARAASNRGWMSFWTSAALAASGKTLVECTEFASLSMPTAREYQQWWFLGALLPVLVFLGFAARLWLSHQLSSTKQDRMKLNTIVSVGVALMLWFGFASFPKWLG